MPNFTTVDDIMIRDVAFATLPGSRDEVLDILKKKHVSGVPVVKNGDLVGIVTRTDLLKNPEEEQLAILMKRDPITITAEKSIVQASRIIIESGIRRLPVVEGNTLVGLVTIADIVGAIASFNIPDPIGDFIDGKVIVVWENTPVSVMGMILEMAEVKAAPVVNKDREILGVVCDKDLINMSIIVDSVEHSDMSAASDDDAWTWESMRDTMSLYYSVSRIKLPDCSVNDAVKLKGEPIFAVPSTSISDAARKMKRNNIDQMPVISANNKLKGMVHDFDLLEALI